MTTSPIFLGIGNPLLDISARVDPAFLKKYNLKSNDAILAAEEHKPLYKDLVDNHTVEYVAGGATQNSMRCAQWLLPAGSTVYIGCVGKDSNVDVIRKAAAKDGLRTEYLEDESAPTGVCAVLITGNDRSMVTDLHAANNYKIEHLQRPEVWSLVESARFYYSSGFFLTVSPPSAMLIAKHAAEHNKVFAINLSAPFISQFFTEPLDALIEYTDIVFGNESEAAAYAEAHKWGTTDVTTIAKKIAALPKANAKRPRIVVFTQGAQPTILVKQDLVREFPVIPIAKEDIVDTNGAGDAFVAGFLSQYVQGLDFETCLSAGNYLANVVIQRLGPTIPSTPHQFKAPVFDFEKEPAM